jgi:hypothetical protein
MPSPSSRSSKKRKTATTNDSNMWNSSGGLRSKKRGSSGSNYQSSRPTIDEEAAEKLFAGICDEDNPTSAGMEGISTFCEKLEIDPLEDIRILVLLWKMGSKEKPAMISKEEWMAGCQKLQLDSLEKFKALLPSLDTGFLDRTEFRDFYKVRYYDTWNDMIFIAGCMQWNECRLVDDCHLLTLVDHYV